MEDVTEYLVLHYVGDWADYRNFALAAPPFSAVRARLLDGRTVEKWLARFFAHYDGDDDRDRVALSPLWSCRVFAELAEKRPAIPELLVANCSRVNEQIEEEEKHSVREKRKTKPLYPCMLSLGQGNIGKDRLQLFGLMFDKISVLLREHDFDPKIVNRLVCNAYCCSDSSSVPWIRSNLPHIFYNIYLYYSTSQPRHATDNNVKNAGGAPPNTHLMTYFVHKDSTLFRGVRERLSDDKFDLKWPPFNYYESIVNKALSADRVDILRDICEGDQGGEAEREERRQLREAMKSHYENALHVISWPEIAAQANAHACFDYLCGVVDMYPQTLWDVVFYGKCDTENDLFEKVYTTYLKNDRWRKFSELPEFGARTCVNIGINVFGEVGRFVRRLRSFAAKGGFDHIYCELSYEPNRPFCCFFSRDGIYMSAGYFTERGKSVRKGRLEVSPSIWELGDAL